MLSVPALSTTEGLIQEMTNVIKRLEEGSMFSWFLQSRFLDLCKASANYLFTNDQRSIYTNLVNRYRAVVAGYTIDLDDNLLDKPFIGDL